MHNYIRLRNKLARIPPMMMQCRPYLRADRCLEPRQVQPLRRPRPCRSHRVCLRLSFGCTVLITVLLNFFSLLLPFAEVSLANRRELDETGGDGLKSSLMRPYMEVGKLVFMARLTVVRLIIIIVILTMFCTYACVRSLIAFCVASRLRTTNCGPSSVPNALVSGIDLWWMYVCV